MIFSEIIEKACSIWTWKKFGFFIIPGHPQGYYTSGKYPNWERRSKYEDYLKHVRFSARMQNFKMEALDATEMTPILVHTITYFQSRIHHDPENVRKGVIDALFYQGTKAEKKLLRLAGKKVKTLQDKYVGGFAAPPLYDKENPRVEVYVAVGEIV